MAALTCKPSSWEVEVGSARVPAHLCLHTEFKISLRFSRICLRKEVRKEEGKEGRYFLALKILLNFELWKTNPRVSDRISRNCAPLCCKMSQTVAGSYIRTCGMRLKCPNFFLLFPFLRVCVSYKYVCCASVYMHVCKFTNTCFE